MEKQQQAANLQNKITALQNLLAKAQENPQANLLAMNYDFNNEYCILMASEAINMDAILIKYSRLFKEDLEFKINLLQTELKYL